mgnify:CR=1 FL=1
MVLMVFIVTAMLTPVIPEDLRSGIVKEASEIFEPFKKMIDKLGLFSALILPLIIFYNNLRLVVLNIFLGILILPPIFITMYNSYVITSFIISGDVVKNLILVLPHGVIEIYAFLLSSALGLRLGMNVLIRKRRFSAELKFCLNKLALITILLLIASFIEVFITPLIYVLISTLSGGSLPTGMGYE